MDAKRDRNAGPEKSLRVRSTTQCESALAHLHTHPGASASEVGEAVYPFPSDDGDAKAAWARRRLNYLVERGLVSREGGLYTVRGER